MEKKKVLEVLENFKEDAEENIEFFKKNVPQKEFFKGVAEAMETAIEVVKAYM